MTTKDFIVRYLILKIATGSYPIGTVIPSENKLATQFHCTRITVRQAYNQLSEMNLLSAKKGVGYFVNQSFLKRVFLPYLSLETAQLQLQRSIKQENSHWVFYEVKLHDKPCGYILFDYRKDLEPASEWLDLDRVFLDYILDCKLSWKWIQEEFIDKIPEDQYQAFTELNQSFKQMIHTEFIGIHPDFSLNIYTYLNLDVFYFKRKINLV